jgi:LysM repeat protein
MMHSIQYRRLIFVLLLGAAVISACTQAYSQAPAATPTLISTGLFVSPFPSGQDPLQLVAQLGTQTAVAKTAQAGGGTVTPGTAVAVSATPGVAGTAAAATQTGTGPTAGSTSSGAVTVVPATKTTAPQTTPIATSVVSVPATYTLQAGEFPYCIARRFNINPDQLLSANGIVDGSVFQPGKTLTIPQSAGPFPGDRALHDHPDTYTVASSDTTIYGVACYYGDALPQDIASANGLSVSSTLKVGQQLNVP